MVNGWDPPPASCCYRSTEDLMEDILFSMLALRDSSLSLTPSGSVRRSAGAVGDSCRKDGPLLKDSDDSCYGYY